MRSVVLVVAFAACGDNYGYYADRMAYDWDGRQLVCSQPIDDYETPEPWDRIDTELQLAAQYGWVAIMHAHIPGETIARATFERVLADAQGYGLEFVTFRDLENRTEPRGGLAFAFDDNAPDQWVTVRDLMTLYGAHVTFFVARWIYMTDPEHQEIIELASDGHDIEPHTVNHLDGPTYVAANGLDAYMQNEVLPSFQTQEVR